ncbi:MAG: hypothetical protein WC975_14945 [Phycisphaerae bacterium]
MAPALEKIKSPLPRKALDYFGSLDDKLLVKNAGFHDYSQQHKEIRILNQAIMENRVILIRCQSPAKAEPEANKFHPYGMVGSLAGGFMDLMKMVHHGNPFYYRYIPVWTFVFQLASLILMFRVYRGWQRLGGDKNYVPPDVSVNIHK